ncbi:hypothetical protein [Marinovum sp.]|uniref:hypothetical protein n=1 Tax=Marinovum sp. TaxID=2024839 RepID=UPI002B2659AF|nr:hypothetical protein [Marinovum sp.]
MSTDLTLTMTPKQYRICNDRPPRPAWMDELHPREAYKALTLMDLYELRAWEQIAAKDDCSCETRYPEWGTAEQEYLDRSEALPQREQTALRLDWIETRKSLRIVVQAICEAQGNW